MGYKSTIRSMNASVNRWARESERESNRLRRENEKAATAQRRENERNTKKAQKIHDKLDSIVSELTKLYASGKIDKQQYETLKLRENDVPIDFLAVIGAPFIALAKRYITGKIDKAEFDSLSQEILPADFIDERNQIAIDADSQFKQYEKFISECIQPKGCKYCGKKGLFTSLSEYKGVQLCQKHANELKALCIYQHYGYYFRVDEVDLVELGQGGAVLNLKLRIENL